MLMTNGVGADARQLDQPASRSITSSVHLHAAVAICKDWHGIWIAFAGYSLIMAILFVPLFRHKHKPQVLQVLPTH